MILPAYELGFTNGDYAFITFELDYNAVLRGQASPRSWFLASSDGTDRFRCKFQEGFESVLTLALDVDESRRAFDIFQTDVKKRSSEVPFPNSTAYQGYIFDNPSLSPRNTTTVSIRFLFLTDLKSVCVCDGIRLVSEVFCAIVCTWSTTWPMFVFYDKRL